MKIKKIEKLKEYKETFSTLWNNPRINGIMKLTIWIILITIMAIIVRTKNTNITKLEPISNIQTPPTSENIKIKLKNITDYKSSINIIKTDNVENVEITNIDNIKTIKYNGEILSDINMIKELNYVDIEKIYKLVEEQDEEYITVYKDNSYIINYRIEKNEFIKIYEELLIEPDEIVNVTITGKEKIEKIELKINDINKIIINLDPQ